jgi:hypothetical protein
MPTVLRVDGYDFLFYAADRDEPAHVHVRRGRQGAKYWLLPLVRLARNVRFRQHELTEIEKIILEHREFLLEAWNDFFGR